MTQSPFPTPAAQVVSPRLWAQRDFATKLGAAPLLVRDVVSVDLTSGDEAAAVMVVNAKRGAFKTGAGDDRVVLQAMSNSVGVGNLFTVDTGAGRDTVTLTGSAMRSEAKVSLGAGDDDLVISGMRTAEVRAGAGDDVVRLTLDGSYKVFGDAGNDTLELAVARAAVTVTRKGEGRAEISWAGQKGVVVSLDGMERVRFADGTVEALVAAPPAPVASVAVATGEPARASAAAKTFLGGTSPTAELIRGTGANDGLAGAKGDTVAGGAGDDTYYLYFGADKLAIVEKAGEGVDTILATIRDHYVAPEGVENVTLLDNTNATPQGLHAKHLVMPRGASAEGNALNNVLTGSAAQNVLDGKGGDDVLVGGAGADVFVFGAGYGQDVVRDFAPGGDRVRLLDGPAGFEALRSSLSDSAAGVVLTLGASALTLEGRRVAELSARDFEFSVDMSAYRKTFGDEFDAFSRFDGAQGGGGTWIASSYHDYDYAKHTATPNGGHSYVAPGWGGADTVSASGGVLSLKTQYRPDLAPKLNGNNYVSGSIDTHATFAQQYGYFEMRAKMDAADGLFPAFWMMPANGGWPPEIDIMEQVGRDAGKVLQMDRLAPVDTTAWHTYGLEWTEDHLAWYIDGELTNVAYAHKVHEPMYLIANVAVGGDWAGPITAQVAPGATVGSMQVDWIHAFQRGDAAVAAAHQPANAPTVTFGDGRTATSGPTDLFRYDAAATGKITLQAAELGFDDVKGWLGLKIVNDRTADSFSASVDVPANGLDVSVRDVDGKVSLKGFAWADVAMTGSKGSTVSLDRVQGGSVSTGAGNDVVSVSAPVVSVAGASLTTTVATGDGNDAVTGWSGFWSQHKMAVDGGRGNDTIRTGTNNDTLAGGAGDDVLFGDAARDVFVMRRAEAGHDTVLDFLVGTDTLRFEGIKAADLSVSQGARGALVSWGPGDVTLEGVSAASASRWFMDFA